MKGDLLKFLTESPGPLPKAPLKNGVIPKDIKKIIKNELKPRGFTQVGSNFFFRETETSYECFLIQKPRMSGYYYLHFGLVFKSIDHLYSQLHDSGYWHINSTINLTRNRQPLKDPYTIENSLTPEQRKDLISTDIDFIAKKFFSQWKNLKSINSHMKRPSLLQSYSVSAAAMKYIQAQTRKSL